MKVRPLCRGSSNKKVRLSRPDFRRAAETAVQCRQYKPQNRVSPTNGNVDSSDNYIVAA
jgi:hypothetical protein